MHDLSGRTLIVTGAGSGIGRATAYRLTAAGARVALMGRNQGRLEETAKAADGETLVVPVDISNRDEVDGAFSKIDEKWGKLHAIVANAGVGGPNHPGPEDRWDEVIRTNVDGTYRCLRAFQRFLAQGPEPRHAIVISSCLARFGVPGYTAYCASKAALTGLVRSLALELAGENVLVNAICPGWVDTPMAREGMERLGDALGKSYEEARATALAAVPLGRMSEPDEVAGLIRFLLSDDARSITGQTLDQNAGSWM